MPETRPLIKVDRQRGTDSLHDVQRLVPVNAPADKPQLDFVWAARVRIHKNTIGILRGNLTTAELATLRRHIHNLGVTKVFEVKTF